MTDCLSGRLTESSERDLTICAVAELVAYMFASEVDHPDVYNLLQQQFAALKIVKEVRGAKTLAHYSKFTFYLTLLT